MRFCTLASLMALAIASGASADNSGSSSGSSDFLKSLASLLSESCQSTLAGVVANGSPLSKCLNLPALGTIIQLNNDSIVPKLETYLQSICSAPACSDAVIDDTTEKVLSGCATDLSSFGIPPEAVRIAMDAYPTARKVVCLSSNSTLCPVKLLREQESYLGTPLSIEYLVSLIISANGTTIDVILQQINDPTGTSALSTLVCNDCVQAAVDVVLYDYPQLEYKTFNLGDLTSGPTTIGPFYKDLCGASVGPNATWPKSIKSTASEAKESVHPSSSWQPSSTAHPSSTGYVWTSTYSTSTDGSKSTYSTSTDVSTSTYSTTDASTSTYSTTDASTSTYSTTDASTSTYSTTDASTSTYSTSTDVSTSTAPTSTDVSTSSAPTSTDVSTSTSSSATDSTPASSATSTSIVFKRWY